MIKKLLKYFLKTLLFVVGFVVLYGVLCLLLPLIPISAEKTTEPKTITISLTECTPIWYYLLKMSL